jgi:subtilisin family serine protease
MKKKQNHFYLWAMFHTAMLIASGCGRDDTSVTDQATTTLRASSALGVGTDSAELSMNGKVDARVSDQLAVNATTDFLVWMQSRADVSAAPNIADWQQRGWFVYDTLRAHAETSQASVRALLAKTGVEYHPFWIANVLFVPAGNAALIAHVASLNEVSRIYPNEALTLQPMQIGATERTIDSVEWGIARIRAPEVWDHYGVSGEGIVVANIDSGVDFTHPALQAQYRGKLGGGVYEHNYNWYDPEHNCSGAEPCDFNSHGTHTMGTMVGDDGAGNRIGVAPSAKWIAAKMCEFDCDVYKYLSAGQWILAPTDLDGLNPDPGLRPHIVNNSWSGGGDLALFYEMVDNWVAAGIFPAFSAGNNGPRCSTSAPPGDGISSYSSGAFDSGNAIATFSSRGPSFSFSGEIKPNIASPGVNIRSSISGGGYASHMGTSMASPHTAGAVALMWSAAPSLVGDISQTRALLDQSAVDMADTTCGGTADDNNVWGEGRLDVYAAVEQSPADIIPGGYLEGSVTNAGDASVIQGARVESSGDGDRRTVTDANGKYSQRLPTGTYNVVASAFGYLSSPTLEVTILEDQTHIQDFSLSPAPSHVVSGRVTSSKGRPVTNVTVAILDTPLAPAVTDANGEYSFADVPAGTYQVQATPILPTSRCHDARTSDLMVDADEVLDFALTDRSDIFGYTCSIPSPHYIDATDVLSLSGDDVSTTVRLPFGFSLYGQTHSSAYVSSNGNLNFAAGNTAHRNSRIPSTAAPNAAIYPLWDDLIIDSSSGIYTELLGAAPNRRFVVEWRNVTFHNTPSLRVDFEVVLYETGNILLQYRNVGTFFRERGDSATVGIENSFGTDALLYSYNEPAIVESSFAIMICTPADTNFASSPCY